MAFDSLAMETMCQNTETWNGTEKRSIKKIQGVKDCHSEIILSEEWSFDSQAHEGNWHKWK